jgi:hypothetical protein
MGTSLCACPCLTILEDGSEALVHVAEGFARAGRFAVFVDGGFAMSVAEVSMLDRKNGREDSIIPESEADEQLLVHLAFAVCHALQRLLLVEHLLVFGHVLLAAKVVEVAGIGLAVKLWYERRTLGA